MLKNRKSLFFSTTIFLVAFFIFSSPKVFADVSKINFISDVQTIPVDQVSSPIIIQIQDQFGNEQKATETVYLNFSSSLNGEFSSNKDTWKSLNTLPLDFSTSSVYIATNSANRTFYYKGLSEGVHQITVYAKSKSGKVFDSIVQNINVGGQSTSTATTTPNNGNSTSTDVITDTSTRTITKVITRYISLHSSEEDLSDYNESSLFKVSAGRERITYVGIPIIFKAKYDFPRGLSCNPDNLFWSFGDGTSGKGEKVLHVYKNQGNYNVILNGSCADKESVSRTSVQVFSPNISISFLPNGDLEIKNNGDMEINIGEWMIIGTALNFIFPKDTLISSKKSIILSKDDSKIIPKENETILLNNPSGREVTSVKFITDKVVDKKDIEDSDIEKILGMTVEKAQNIVTNYRRSYSQNNISKIENEDRKVVLASTTGEVKKEIKIVNTATVMDAVGTTSDSWSWGNSLGRYIKNFGRIFYDF
jgi:hypothetical protein